MPDIRGGIRSLCDTCCEERTEAGKRRRLIWNACRDSELLFGAILIKSGGTGAGSGCLSDIQRCNDCSYQYRWNDLFQRKINKETAGGDWIDFDCACLSEHLKVARERNLFLNKKSSNVK